MASSRVKVRRACHLPGGGPLLRAEVFVVLRQVNCRLVFDQSSDPLASLEAGIALLLGSRPRRHLLLIRHLVRLLWVFQLQQLDGVGDVSARRHGGGPAGAGGAGGPEGQAGRQGDLRRLPLLHLVHRQLHPLRHLLLISDELQLLVLYHCAVCKAPRQVHCDRGPHLGLVPPIALLQRLLHDGAIVGDGLHSLPVQQCRRHLQLSICCYPFWALPLWEPIL
mmetsp:Transcript_8860/g.26577  ORF Transcript_8860/g.26577 Transcript_8860/m.26577 type:complete len:222 (-) Transcript_8860:747-1412(-)